MRSPVLRFVATVVLVALALAATAALAVDYSRATPVFCSEGGGCDALRQTGFAHPFGIPLPLVGAFAFALLGTLALSRGHVARTLNLAASGVGGLIGLALLALQVVLGHFCPYCAIVDVSAVLLAALAWDRVRGEWDRPPGVLAPLFASLGFLAVFVVPTVWGRHVVAAVPLVIAKELSSTPPGDVTVVDFVDFECPFCRRMQSQVESAVKENAPRVHVVRRHVPLTRIHAHALAAARAACCAEVLGKGDAMADALFEAPVDDLTPEGCERVAVSLGLAVDQYRSCLLSPDVDARLERDKREFDQAAAKGDGLPLMWVGETKLMGARPEGTVDRLIKDALARAGS
jgi:uncharacterized membrane protein/predicted DsbA family dithiol-disulfide isomerase